MVNQGRNRPSWNTKELPSPVLRIEPFETGRRPAISLSRVVLPQPDGPRITVGRISSPSRTKLKSLNIFFPLKSKEISSIITLIILKVSFKYKEFFYNNFMPVCCNVN
jgi:hypothetical protein